MRKQVAMAPNGQLAVIVPLYPEVLSENLTSLDGYRMSLTEMKPLAYVIDVGAESPVLMNAKFVETNCEILGEL